MAAAVEGANGDIVSSMTSKLEMRQGPRRPRGEACTIDKVPDEIRKEDPEAYEPQIVSIGPIHHGKPKLLPMEDVKWQFLNSLIGRHGSNSLEKYINAVSKPSVVQQIAECYSEEVIGAHGRNTLVEIMVLDGCFIIEYFLKSLSWEPMGELDFVDWSEVVKNDLLLIENQIPFSLLDVLYDSCHRPPYLIGDGNSPIPISKLAAFCLSLDGRFIDYPITLIPVPQIIHNILHLSHSLLHQTSTDALSAKRQLIPKNLTYHALSVCLFSLLLSRWPFQRQMTYYRFRVPRTMASATELQQAGIIFRAGKKARFGVTFRYFDGIMEFPLLTVKATSMSRFRNLVALEEYLPDIGKPVTTFLVLMNSLIDTPADVAILVKSGVLRSKLDGDEEVVDLFKTLGKAVYLDNNHDHLALLGLLKDVNYYRDARRHVERVTWLPSGLTKPELFVAGVALYLSIVQTVVAVVTFTHTPKS